MALSFFQVNLNYHWVFAWEFSEIIKNIYLQKQAEVWNFIKKGTLAQAFSCEFGEIVKNTFLTEHLWATASVSSTASVKGCSVNSTKPLGNTLEML